MNKSEYQKSVHYFTKAIENYDEDDKMMMLKAYSNLGIAYYLSGKTTPALEYFYYCLEQPESHDDKDFLAKQYGNIGNVYSSENNTKKAYEYFKKSYALFKSTGNEQEIANLFNILAFMKTRENDDAMALAYLKKSYKLFAKHNNKRALLSVTNNIAKMLLQCNKHDDAMGYLETQIELAKSLNIQSILCLGYINIAVIKAERKEFEQASEMFDKSEELIEALDCDNLRMRFFPIKISFLEAQKQYKEALELFHKLDSIKQKIYEDRLSEKMKSIQTNLEIKEKEEETEIYRAKNIELANAFKEIDKQKKQLSEANIKLEELSDAKDAIIGVVSHDLKNYVGSIYSISDFMTKQVNDSKMQNYLQAVKQSSQNALILLQDLLEINYIESTDFKLDLKQVNIRELFENNFYPLELSAKTKDIKIELDLADDTNNLMIDSVRFWQAFSNIVFNAIKYSKRGGIVQIKVYKQDEKCIIEIIDNGIGISEKMLPFVFEKFTIAKRQGTEGELTFGMGLYTSKALINMHGGEISVKSSPNTGSVFAIIIPCL